MKSAACFAAGMATGLGIAVVTASTGRAALACVSVLAILLAGVLLGRASNAICGQIHYDPDDDLPDDYPMVPSHPVPMEHSHEEDD